jgi:hypothetical protein
MNIAEYCGSTEFPVLQFIFSLTDDIREKIVQKKLFYKEQIIRYANKQIDFFFKSKNLACALEHSYKNEVYNTIMFKLNYILKEHPVLQCI